MAAITVTPGSVVMVSGAYDTTYKAGSTITAGQALRLDVTATPPNWVPADTDSSVTTAGASAVAITGGSVGQPITTARAGAVVNMGATLAVGTIYILDGAAGGICPSTDVAQNDWVTVIGVAITAANMQLICVASGVQVP